MSHVIKVLGLADGSWHAQEDTYLQSFDPDAHDGRGDAELTDDLAAAMRFENAVEAMRLWQTQSTVQPTRLDGKPNKPLTAFTIEVKQVVD